MLMDAYSSINCNTEVIHEGKRAGAPEALPPCPVPLEGTFLSGCSCVRSHQKWKKGLPANRQPLHKGASGMSDIISS